MAEEGGRGPCSWTLHSHTLRSLFPLATLGQRERPHIQSHPSSVPETKIKVKVSFGTFFPSKDMLLCSVLALLMATALRNEVEGKGEGGWWVDTRATQANQGCSIEQQGGFPQGL